jgi:protein-tyrosine phosphatase
MSDLQLADPNDRLARSYRGLDVTRLYPGLWMGSAPPTGTTLHSAGFDVLVLAATEYQPRSRELYGIEVIHVPLLDVDRPLGSETRRAICSAASMVAQRVRRGKRVLVTCAAGRNRSGVIAAVALAKLAQITPIDAARIIREVRVGIDGGPSMSNPSFNAFLRGLRC